MSILSSIFNRQKLDAPVLYKKQRKSPVSRELKKLREKKLPKKLADQIDQEIKNCELGDKGEKLVEKILMKSDQPMYILHDVYLKDQDVDAQIDFLVITRKLIFVLECKNYQFHSQIDKKGQFKITKSQQVISSPVDQNSHHLKVISRVFPEWKKRLIPVVVFTNADTYPDITKAPKKIHQQLIKADALPQFILNKYQAAASPPLSDAQLQRCADAFHQKHQEDLKAYQEKYRKYIQFYKDKAEAH